MTDESRLLAARLLAASPSAMPLEDALEHIRARRAQLLLAQPQSPPITEDFGPKPMPIVEEPEKFAANFWDKRQLPGPTDEPPKPKPKPKSKRPPGRRPIGDLGPAHDKFRVVDGDNKK
jgi:hypothetical protein